MKEWVTTVPNDGLPSWLHLLFLLVLKHVKLWEGKAVDGQKILRSARLEVAVQVRLLRLLQA